ncbi:MAG TPA: DUF3159 domain-containing protein [Mycobacteriales bacterium]|nr:DUF3159 domain-containing protein [Mycobacteriales bacterium]
MPEDEVPEQETKELTAGTLLEVFGGWKGLFDGSVPATVFVLARFFASLNVSIAAAVAAGLVVVAVRRARGETLQHAFSGFFGLVVAVLVVHSTGTGKGIFLPGILITAGSGAAFALSLLVGRPAVALGLAAADPRYAAWRTHEPLRRACVLATAVWAASFFVRAGVATTVYLTYGDRPQDNLMILIIINAVKWPLIVGSALLTVALVRRAGLPAGDDVPAPH